MEDAKLQRLHDTLAMLRPKGRTGGLGRGSYGVTKKKDDGLPDNALYSHFVRQGQGNFTAVKKFEDSDDDENKDDIAAKKKKMKDAKKAKKAKEAADEAAAAAAAAAEASGSGKKRKRKEAGNGEATDKAVKAADDASGEGVEGDWAAAVKAALKAAPGKAMDAKALRKACQARVASGTGLEKKKVRKAFEAALASLAPKVYHNESTGVVSYIKKSK